jgi:hypothetical protein
MADPHTHEPGMAFGTIHLENETVQLFRCRHCPVRLVKRENGTLQKMVIGPTYCLASGHRPRARS